MTYLVHMHNICSTAHANNKQQQEQQNNNNWLRQQSNLPLPSNRTLFLFFSSYLSILLNPAFSSIAGLFHYLAFRTLLTNMIGILLLLSGIVACWWWLFAHGSMYHECPLTIPQLDGTRMSCVTLQEILLVIHKQALKVLTSDPYSTWAGHAMKCLMY